ncbi:MAG: hypothetical protein DRN81_01310 [Thermoproteota archaeon]|nr:MAG: hypothetical protein DRN81_01310 [Candidatus Korarchaeota archaeon]
MNKNKIKRDKEVEQVYLALLNEHFETVSLEKYNDAMMNLIFTEACEKTLGKNFRKQRISKRKEKKIKEYVENKLRHKYGKWVNMTDFKIKNISNIFFKTNLDRVFNVPGLGKLYGAYYRCCCGNIFFTEHCLERFEERANPLIYILLRRRMEEHLKGPATSVDILSGLLSASSLEYGRKDNYYHVNATVGILVVEDFGDVFIAKTFLSPDMIKPVKWFKPDIYDRETVSSFSDVINCKGEYIDNPQFIEEMIQKDAGANSC